MRASNALFLLFVSACCAAGQREPDFKALYDSHQWFQLRDAVAATPDTPAFYRGAVAAAFNDPKGAEKFLRPLIESAPQPLQAAAARELLDTLYWRLGQIRKADPTLKLPDQSIDARGFSRFRKAVKNGYLVLPILVNGKPARFVVDTGCPYASVMSESEAKRLGLVVRAETSLAGDAAGRPVPGHIAVAGELTVGKFRLRDAMCWVYRDDMFWPSQWPSPDRGAIGLPVLLAFGTLRWTDDGTIELGHPSARRCIREANLCFDDLSLMAGAGFRQKSIVFFFDTGSDHSELGPRFREEFASTIGESVKTETRRVLSADNVSKEIHQQTLPALRFHLGGIETVLRPATVLLDENEFHGDYARLGTDLLDQAHAVTIDFNSMTLTLRGQNPAWLLASHDWFKFRDAVRTANVDPFLRGVAACGANDSKKCEKDLQAAIKSDPDSSEAYAAHASLTYLYSRIGRSQDALAQLQEMHKAAPDADDVKKGLAMFTVLSRYPDQSASKRHHSRLRCKTDEDGTMFVPVSIDGRSANYRLNLGAPYSAMSKSEAQRLGLTVDTAGAETVAVAGRLTVGDMELRNVVFLVLPDDQFGNRLPDRRGSIGLTVLLAFETVRWSTDGTVEIGFKSSRGDNPNSSLFLDGYTLLTPAGPVKDITLAKPPESGYHGMASIDFRTMTMTPALQ
jgi:predicted aspartyl protease